MKKFIVGRNYGKSIGVIIAATQEGAVMFCANKESEKRAQEKAAKLGLKINTKVL